MSLLSAVGLLLMCATTASGDFHVENTIRGFVGHVKNKMPHIAVKERSVGDHYNDHDHHDHDHDHDHDDDHDKDMFNGENIFDFLGYVLHDFFEELSSWDEWDDMLDTTGGMTANITDMLDYFHGSFCPVAGSVCDRTDNSSLLGCNCMEAFQSMTNSACQRMPCKLIEHTRTNLATLLNGIRYSRGVADVVRAVFTFAGPLTDLTCDCSPALYRTLITCVAQYDGAMLEEEDRTDYESAMQGLDFGALHKVLETASWGYCNNGCNSEFNGILVKFAEMFDNSWKTGNRTKCNTFRYLSEDMKNIVMDIIKFATSDTESYCFPPFVNMILQKATGLQNKFWCSSRVKDCIDDRKKHFHSCCTQNAIKAVATEDVIKGTLAWMKSLVKTMDEEANLPQITKKTMRKLVRAADPTKMCSAKYSDSDTVCPAATF